MTAATTMPDIELALPARAANIAVVRHAFGAIGEVFAVDEETLSNIRLAVTEACTNVLRHAGPGRRYEVVVEVGRNRCVLQVLDNGRGIDSGRLRAARRRAHLRRPPVGPAQILNRRVTSGNTDVQQLPESGRGLAIMRACVDDVSLRSGRGQGTVVQLRKRIELRDDAPLANLGDWPLRDVG